MSDFRQQIEEKISELEEELADLRRIKAREDKRYGVVSPSASPPGKPSEIIKGNVTAFIHDLIKSELVITKDEIKRRVKATEKFKKYDGRQVHFAILNLKNRNKIEEKSRDEWKFLND